MPLLSNYWISPFWGENSVALIYKCKQVKTWQCTCKWKGLKKKNSHGKLFGCVFVLAGLVLLPWKVVIVQNGDKFGIWHQFVLLILFAFRLAPYWLESHTQALCDRQKALVLNHGQNRFIENQTDSSLTCRTALHLAHKTTLNSLSSFWFSVSLAVDCASFLSSHEEELSSRPRRPMIR